MVCECDGDAGQVKTDKRERVVVDIEKWGNFGELKYKQSLKYP